MWPWAQVVYLSWSPWEGYDTPPVFCNKEFGLSKSFLVDTSTKFLRVWAIHNLYACTFCEVSKRLKFTCLKFLRNIYCSSGLFYRTRMLILVKDGRSER